MQWWGALTQQFQSIAADAMKDVAQKAAPAPVGMPADPVPGPVAQGNSLADQAMAAMAASREALAQSTRKTLQDGAALMGKSLKQSAWPVPGAAVAVKKAIKKPAAKPAISSTASPRAKPVAPKPASAVLKKAPAKSTAKPSAARKPLR